MTHRVKERADAVRRVLLLAPPGEALYIRDNYCSYVSKTRSYWSPIDLLVQSGHLAPHFAVHVLDAPALGLARGPALAAAAAVGADAVLALTGLVSWHEDEAFLRALVARSAGRVPRVFVAGDVCLTNAAELLARWEFAEGALLDYTAPDLARRLAGAPGPFRGLALRDAPATDPRPSRGFHYPVPAHDRFPLARYHLPLVREPRFATVVTSVGCPLRCPFCIDSILPLRLRDLANVAEELTAVKRLGMREVFFYDPMLTTSARRVAALSDILEPLRLGWLCNAHVARLDEGMVARMRRAGCHTVQLGIESGSDAILGRYKEGVTRERSLGAVRMLQAEGIRTLGFFVLGLPGESEREARETVEFAVELGLDYASFNIFCPVAETDLGRTLGGGRLALDACATVDRTTGTGRAMDGGPSAEELDRLRRHAYRRFYLRPAYLARQLRDAGRPGRLAQLVRDFGRFLAVNLRRYS